MSIATDRAHPFTTYDAATRDVIQLSQPDGRLKLTAPLIDFGLQHAGSLGNRTSATDNSSLLPYIDDKQTS